MKKMRKIFAPVYRSLYFPPAVIFVAVALATTFGWLAAQETLRHDINVAADSKADTVQQSLREHMVTYEQILHGGAGLFRSSTLVTHEEWENFLNVFSVDTDLSGVQVIGLAKVFNQNDLSGVTEFMEEEGIENFKVTPEQPERGQYAALLYIHDVGTSKAPVYGYDMYTEPVRKQAMERARDTGEISMTPRLELLSQESAGQNFGFNVFVPLYKRSMPTSTTEERRAALDGFVYASFKADSFFKNIIGGADNKNVGFLVRAENGGTPSTMYESPTYKDVASGRFATVVSRKINLYGQTWTINFATDTRTLVSDEQLSRPEGLLFFGTLSSFLVAAVVLLLIKARARDLSTQKEQAVELAKDELLSLASHQLRTPATGVKQYVGMVLQGFAGKVPPTQRKLLEKAYASNDRQLRIINEILHLAKIDSGRIVLAKQLTNLNELVSDVVTEQTPDIKSADHKITVGLPTEPLVIHADTHMLRMAIENLLSNAIKYTPNGGSITVKVYKKNSFAYISITDTGVGISAEDTDKVFRQFSRLSNVMSQRVGGTGIGLYLAKHLVELHNGQVTMESQPGKGSTFTIAMPLHESLGQHMRNLTVRPKS